MSKEDHVNQHIAPQAYLNHFAKRIDDKYLIGVWQKGTKNREPKLFRNSVENVGYIKRFYDVSTRPDKKYWEKYFAEHVDWLYGTPLNSVIARITLCRKDSFILTESERQLLATIICSQMLRVPKVISKNLESAPQFITEWKEEFLDANRGFLSADQERIVRGKLFAEDEIKDIILEHITGEKNMTRYISILKERLWLIYINNTDFQFITSDSPVLHYNLLGNSLDSKDTGIARLDTALIFALNPRIMLHLLPQSFQYGLLEEYDGKIMVLDDRNLKFISNYNSLQLENCYQQAFMSLDMLETIRVLEQDLSKQIEK